MLSHPYPNPDPYFFQSTTIVKNADPDPSRGPKNANRCNTIEGRRINYASESYYPPPLPLAENFFIQKEGNFFGVSFLFCLIFSLSLHFLFFLPSTHLFSLLVIQNIWGNEHCMPKK